MKTIIYLVRHGEVHNPDKIMYERLPGFRLSEIGKNQAHKLGQYLSEKPISAIYASPLERTRETADIIATYHNGLSIIYDERLLEVLTTARGKSIEYLAEERWNFYKPKYTKHGGEKLSDIWKRMQKAIYDIVKKHKGQEIVIVSHGDPLMVSMVKHKGRPLRLAEIRGEEYVQTAGGFRLVFDEFRAVEVDKLDF
jgi:broad specificity phosphatase PhoE